VRRGKVQRLNGEITMEFTREIYWNVGHHAGTLVPMYLLAITAAALLVWLFRQRIQVYKKGLPLARNDQPKKRLAFMLKSVLLQQKVTRVPGPGLLHGLFFWGFGLLVCGTALILIQTDFTDHFFNLVFLKGTFYKLFSMVLDVAGLLCIAILAGLFVRRYAIRPEGLETRKIDALMHGFLLVILLTGFVIEGSRMAVTELGSGNALWSPVGLVFAKAMSGLGEAGLRTVHKMTWWSHLVLVMGFFVLVPLTKLRHIVTTSAGYFLTDLGPKGKLINLDLEDEEAENFGATNVKELYWKDIFDSDACTLCKRCQDRCPAYQTGKPLSPMKIVKQVGEAAFSDPDTDLIGLMTPDALWACTTCRACQEICPANIEHVRKIVELRRSMVLMEGQFPGEEVMAAMEAAEVNGNPLGMGYAERGEWARELGVKTMSEDPDVDLLYFVGCYAAFDKRNIKVAKSFVRLCQAAGIKVGILGKEEKCCGEPMRKMGNEYLYQSLAMENIGRMQTYEVKRVVATCPHCFNTLAKDYKDLGFTAEVVSATEYLCGLLENGRLKVQADALTCTYHDSCYLGRHNDIYDAPRKLIRAAGGKLVEMEKSRAESFCCSAGGGRILAEEKLGQRINIKRVQMALDTGADILVSNCPFCLTMFEDGIKGAQVEDRLSPRDITEVLVERLVQ
jgi:Fe-S oxidoreductase/nitrate reductase gamma subunit